MRLQADAFRRRICSPASPNSSENRRGCRPLNPIPGAPSALWHWLSLLLALGVIASALAFALLSGIYRWNWSSVWAYRALFLKGWLVTVVISAISLAGQLPGWNRHGAAAPLPGAASPIPRPHLCGGHSRHTAARAVIDFLLCDLSGFRPGKPVCRGGADALGFLRRLYFGSHPGGHRERGKIATGKRSRHRA